MRFFMLSLLCAVLAFSPSLSKAEDIAAKKSVEQQKVENKTTEVSSNTEGEPEEEQKEFITEEEKAKQAIAENNYSLSYFTQHMDLSLEQLDVAKKLSEDDKMKREALLQSIYMLRDQSRELEQESIDNFKELLNEEQLAVFEELRKEQLKYRANYDVLDSGVKERVDADRKIIKIDELQRKTETKKTEELKKIAEELKREEDYKIKHGRWNLFD